MGKIPKIGDGDIPLRNRTTMRYHRRNRPALTADRLLATPSSSRATATARDHSRIMTRAARSNAFALLNSSSALTLECHGPQVSSPVWLLTCGETSGCIRSRILSFDIIISPRYRTDEAKQANPASRSGVYGKVGKLKGRRSRRSRTSMKSGVEKEERKAVDESALGPPGAHNRQPSLHHGPISAD